MGKKEKPWPTKGSFVVYWMEIGRIRGVKKGQGLDVVVGGGGVAKVGRTRYIRLQGPRHGGYCRPSIRKKRAADGGGVGSVPHDQCWRQRYAWNDNPVASCPSVKAQYRWQRSCVCEIAARLVCDGGQGLAESRLVGRVCQRSRE